MPDHEPREQTRPQTGGHRYHNESERREARRQRARRRKRTRNIFLGLAGGIIAILLIGSISSSSFINFLPVRGGGGGNRDEGPGQHFAILRQDHIPANVNYQDYNSSPPTSGPHYATPADWGVYTEGLKSGNFIHSMEEGGVIVHYNTEDSETIQRLEGILLNQRGSPCYLILHPNPNIEQDTIALTAWGALDQMPLTELTDERIVGFLEFYRNLPVANHPSVPCDPAFYNL